MGFSLPSGVVNTDSLSIYVPAVGAIPLGPYIKQPSDQTLVIIDFFDSGATPIVTYSFSVDVSTNPQLVLAYPQIDATGHSLSFLMSGGIVGQQYDIQISIQYQVDPDTTAGRVEHLIISIPSTAGTDIINPVPAIYNQIPLWGGGYINSAVRAFWGSVPPSNPNVLDQWFSTADGILYEWATDGTTPQWVIIYSDKYLIDAPNDGVLYGRLDDTWSPVPISEILFDAPGDGLYYARQNHLWAAVPRIPQPSDTLPLMNAPVPVAGVNIDFARVDHVHPTDSSLYSASNPAGYQTKADVTASLGSYMPLSGGEFTGTVSFRTAALFASPTNIQVGGGAPSYVLSTNGSGALSWVPPTVGISDAPVDTQTYARSGGQWINITHATGVPEAPNDGQLWGRESLTWVVVPIGGGAGIPDSPNDGTKYARQNTSGTGAWQHLVHTDITDWSATLGPYALITNLPQPSGTAPLMDGGGAIGTSVTYARADHSHPSDTSRYSASNPAQYISEAANDGTAYARKNTAWTHLTHNDISDWVASSVPATISSTPPASPLPGVLWWNTGDQQLYIWNGAAWVIAVTPPIIPEAPNNGQAYARRSLSWSRLTHNDITDWSATLGNYLPLAGGTLTGALGGTTFSMSGNASLTGTLSVFGNGGGAGSYIGFFDGTTTRKGYIGQFSSGMVWANDAQATNIILSTDGWIHMGGPVTGSSNIQGAYLYSTGDVVAAGNMSCGWMYGQVSTGGTVQAGYLRSTGSGQIDGDQQVNGNFNCTNTVSGYTGNFSYSTIYGNLQVNNLITASNTIRSTNGRIVSQGNSNPSLCAYNTVGYASAFFCDANGNAAIGDADGSGNPTNYRFQIDRSNNASTNGGSLTTGYLHSTGTVQADGDVAATGNVFAHSAVYCDNQNGGFFHRAADGTAAMQIYCNTNNNNAVWANNRTNKNIQQTSNSFFQSSVDTCVKPTAGQWQSSSDKRLKTILGPYKAGLKEILRLEPKEFHWKGNLIDRETREVFHADHVKEQRRCVGYIADEIMRVMPETVSLTKGIIDDVEVEDLKILDQTNVMHALVNAMKEMYTEVQSLRKEVAMLKEARA